MNEPWTEHWVPVRDGDGERPWTLHKCGGRYVYLNQRDVVAHYATEAAAQAVADRLNQEEEEP